MRPSWAMGLILAAVTTAAANGRESAVMTINFRQTHEADVIAGLTFGAAISHDGGATWHWYCEDAIGYGGMYDPDYAYSRTGKIFATTFSGLKASSDGCVFAPTVEGTKFASSDELGPDGALYVGMADPADSDIYRSTDDGATFGALTMPGMVNDWWQSIAIAPSDAQRVYLTGYRFVPSPIPDAGTVKEFLLFTSTTGGAAWTPMQLGAITASQSSAIEIAGISKADPLTLYARVTLADGAVGDALYRSGDAGQTWKQILAMHDQLRAFVVRANGDLVAGTPTLGTQVSHDHGDTWIPLANPPHVTCLVEDAAGEVWACTRNYGTGQVPFDGFGIMKTTDLVTWTGVLRFQDILGPVDCPAGTVQKDRCEKTTWCTLRMQLGITSGAIACATAPDATIVAKSGCCESSPSSAPGALLLGLGTVVVLRRRRRDP